MYIATEPQLSPDLKLILAILVPFGAILLIALVGWLAYRLHKHHSQPREMMSTNPYGYEAGSGTRTLASSSFYSPVWPDNKRFSSHIRETVHSSPFDLTKTETITPPVPALQVVPPQSSLDKSERRSSIRLVASDPFRKKSSSEASLDTQPYPHTRSDSRRHGFLIEHEPTQMEPGRFTVDAFWRDCEYRQVEGTVNSTPGLAY